MARKKIKKDMSGKEEGFFSFAKNVFLIFMFFGAVASIFLANELLKNELKMAKLEQDLRICNDLRNMPLVLWIYEDLDSGDILICEKHNSCVNITEIVNARANQLANIKQTYLLSLIANNYEYKRIVCGG